MSKNNKNADEPIVLALTTSPVRDIKEGKVSNETNGVSTCEPGLNQDDLHKDASNSSSKKATRKRKRNDGTGSQSDSEATEKKMFPWLRDNNDDIGNVSDEETANERARRRKRICWRNLSAYKEVSVIYPGDGIIWIRTKTNSGGYVDVSDSSSEFFDEGAAAHTTCWIMKASIYRDHQKFKIRSKHDAVKLLRAMKENIRNLIPSDVPCYRRWWLNTATQYHNIELVDLMLAEKCFELNIKTNCNFNSPLYVAIQYGEPALVQTFLRAGASVTSNPLANAQRSRLTYFNIGQKTANDMCRLQFFGEYVSAVEYACVFNKPEVVKLLMVHFNSKHLPRTRADLSLDEFSDLIHAYSGLPVPEECVAHPLHCIVMLATRFYGQELARLPTFVQIVIDAGGNVHYVDECGYTPLQLLIYDIRRMDALGTAGAEYRRIIYDIAKVLLNAGSSANMESFECPTHDPLNLLERHVYTFHYTDMSDWTSTYFNLACALLNKLQLINDLARLLLVNGADVSRSGFCRTMLLTVFRFLRNREYKENREHCANVHDDIMDTLGDLLRVILLAGANSLTDDYWSKFLNQRWFVESFIGIACYSSRPGRSHKLIDMLLYAFSTNNIKKLRAKLLSNRDSAPAHSTDLRHSREETDLAITYVDRIETPQRLQYMAYRAINRAISTRGLSDVSVRLGLPPALESLILLQ